MTKVKTGIKSESKSNVLHLALNTKSVQFDGLTYWYTDTPTQAFWNINVFSNRYGKIDSLLFSITFDHRLGELSIYDKQGTELQEGKDSIYSKDGYETLLDYLPSVVIEEVLKLIKDKI